MMGYTHVATGAAASIAVSYCIGLTSPESYLVAVAAGAVGGIAPDFDVQDQKGKVKVTDGSRSRIAVLGIVAVAAVLDLAFGCGILASVIQRQYLALGGLIVFIALSVIGYRTDHRTFTHSVLCAALMGACVYAIYPQMTPFFLVGFALHLLLDILNNPFHNRGTQILFPIKTGERFALGWCKSGGKGNKVFYFIGIVAFAAVTCLWVAFNHADVREIVIPVAMLAYMSVVLHFVRVKSERELRRIQHIRGEL